MRPVVIIPARMESTRFPQKILADIEGTAMIVHVYNRAKEANIGPVYVACCSPEIVEVIESAGGNAILTDPSHPSGTDRIFEAFNKIKQKEEYDVVVNVQGDLPTIDPKIIKDVLKPFKDDEVDITTLVAKITDDSEQDNPNVVKAVIDWYEQDLGNGLDFTRDKAPAKDGFYYHHIGLYAYRTKVLEKFVSLEQSPREKAEKLEQLRALENNMRIDVVNVDTIPLGVDTKEDLEKAKSILAMAN